MTASPAQGRLLTKLGPRPDRRLVIGGLSVAIETRVPSAAALELDRDDVERRMPMSAPSLAVNIAPIYLTAVDNSHE
jgi:hypothetical protein